MSIFRQLIPRLHFPSCILAWQEAAADLVGGGVVVIVDGEVVWQEAADLVAEKLLSWLSLLTDSKSLLG